MVEIKTLKNGNLMLTVPKGTKRQFTKEINDLWKEGKCSYDGLWDLILENNPDYRQVNGDNLGHMTSSPFIVLDLIWDDNGRDYECAAEWWFPAYEVCDPIFNYLMHYYYVEFTLNTKR